VLLEARRDFRGAEGVKEIEKHALRGLSVVQSAEGIEQSARRRITRFR
jgi:hypothetical protein